MAGSHPVIQERLRLRNPGVNGCILQVEERIFAKLDTEWKYHPIRIAKLMRKIEDKKIRIGGIEIWKDGKEKSFIQIEPTGYNRFVISVFNGNNDKADFSISMTLAYNQKKAQKGICFKDMAKELERNTFHNVGNFVLCMFWHICYHNIDTIKNKSYQLEYDVKKKLDNPNGCIFKVNESFLTQLDTDKENRFVDWTKLTEEVMSKKLCIGGIEINDQNNKEKLFVQIERIRDGRFSISAFKKDNTDSVFSIEMNLLYAAQGPQRSNCFSNMAREFERNIFTSIGDLVLYVFKYAYCRKVDTRNSKYYLIEDDSDWFEMWEQYRNS